MKEELRILELADNPTSKSSRDNEKCLPVEVPAACIGEGKGVRLI